MFLKEKVISTLNKLHSGINYDAVGCEFTINESAIYCIVGLTEM